jgi:hypothetical protein
MATDKWRKTQRLLKKLGFDPDEFEIGKYKLGDPPFNFKSPVGGARVIYRNYTVDCHGARYYVDNRIIAMAYIVAVVLFKLPVGNYHQFDIGDGLGPDIPEVRIRIRGYR